MPAYGKKAYEDTAQIIRSRYRGRGDYAVEMIALDFADLFENLNHRFDRARFLEACGVEDGIDRTKPRPTPRWEQP